MWLDFHAKAQTLNGHRSLPPTFSWNAGMVMHILKGDPTLRDLKHIQVHGPGTAYLFFFDKQSHRGLTLDAMQTLRTHVGEAFAEWIPHSVHFAVILLPLAEGSHQVIAALEWHLQRSRAEYQGCPTSNPATSSTLLSLGQMSQAEETGGGKASKVPTSKWRGRLLKACPTKDVAWNSPPSSPDRGGANSDGYSTVSEALSTHCHRRRWQHEKCLAPMHLDMPIFKLT